VITAEKCLKCKCLCTPASLLRDSRKEEPSFFGVIIVESFYVYVKLSSTL
jgi:hypothetical protein